MHDNAIYSPARSSNGLARDIVYLLTISFMNILYLNLSTLMAQVPRKLHLLLIILLFLIHELKTDLYCELWWSFMVNSYLLGFNQWKSRMLKSRMLFFRVLVCSVNVKRLNQSVTMCCAVRIWFSSFAHGTESYTAFPLLLSQPLTTQGKGWVLIFSSIRKESWPQLTHLARGPRIEFSNALQCMFEADMSCFVVVWSIREYNQLIILTINFGGR